MKRIVIALCMSLAVSAGLWAQATAQISGIVRDQSGGVTGC
jgi:hypothetical protein